MMSSDQSIVSCWYTCQAAVLADDAAVVVGDVKRSGWETALTMDARETTHVIDRTVADLMNEVIWRHTVSATVAPGAVVPAPVARRQGRS